VNLSKQPTVAIDAVADPAVRTAVIVSIAVEAFATLAMVVMYYNTFGDGFSISDQVKKWRTKLLGPPPPTEEEIQHQVHLLNIEAMKIMREAE
jgi:hypothetical protein